MSGNGKFFFWHFSIVNNFLSTIQSSRAFCNQLYKYLSQPISQTTPRGDTWRVTAERHTCPDSDEAGPLRVATWRVSPLHDDLPDHLPRRGHVARRLHVLGRGAGAGVAVKHQVELVAGRSYWQGTTCNHHYKTREQKTCIKTRVGHVYWQVTTACTQNYTELQKWYYRTELAWHETTCNTHYN